MFKIKSSRNKSLFSGSNGNTGVVQQTHNIGWNPYERREDEQPNRDFISESTQVTTPMGPGSNMSSTPITLDLDPLLTGMTPALEQRLYNLYRDIYYHDSVCGAAADLYSQIPFSEFSLGGLQDKKIESVYLEVIERLNTRTLLPEISLDYLVLGTHCSSLLYNKTTKQFVDLMPHRIDDIKLTELPFFSQDPILEVKFPEIVRNSISYSTQRYEQLKELIGEAILDKIKHGSLDLDPISTIYLPRKTFTNSKKGTSYFKRVLPIWLIEKNLFRGTMMESARRQRGILHLSLGEGEDWVPTVADMEFMTDLFMNADADPLGAIIATRTGVSVEEIRQGGDFWKVSDYQDTAFSYKLRALGISEAFLSGDISIAAADANISVFIDMLRSYRDMITRKFFYDKLFPLISLVNGYAVNTKGKVVVNDRLKDVASVSDAMKILNDGSKLLIPTVCWSKQLKPEGDTAYLEMLNGMTEKGVPVPLRVLAAAGGLHIDELLRQQTDDLDIRKKVADYLKEIQKLNPQPAAGGGEEEYGGEASSILASEFGTNSSTLLPSGGKRVPLLERDYTDYELHDLTKTGKPKVMPRRVQNKKNESINKIIVKSMRNAEDKGKFKSSTTEFD